MSSIVVCNEEVSATECQHVAMMHEFDRWMTAYKYRAYMRNENCARYKVSIVYHLMMAGF